MARQMMDGDSGDRVRRWQAPEVGDPVRRRPVRSGPAQGSAERSTHGPAERPAEAVAPVSPAEPAGEPAPAPMTVEQIEAIQQEARAEGFREGEAAGRREGAAAVQAEAEHLARVLDSLVPSVEGLDRRLEQELVTLAVTVARQLVRRELRTEPGQIVAAVREAFAVLPSSERRVRLHLHPEDARIVREALNLSELEQPWKVIEDPTLSRGGAWLETDISRVDATVESRLNAVVAEMWGGERREDGRAGDGPTGRSADRAAGTGPEVGS
ncbi:MAG: flagellar assembly protein FliH [Thioalkalivibrio sp.]|nr:MAG: flagellar assembly protein FliH [Thioalkalivibrio sp.]